MLQHNAAEVGVVVPDDTWCHPVAGPSVAYAIIILPGPDPGKEPIRPGVAQSSVVRINLVDVDRGIGDKHARADRTIPIDVQITPTATATRRDAAVGNRAVVPEIGQENLAFADDIPRAAPHPQPLLGCGH